MTFRVPLGVTTAFARRHRAPPLAAVSHDVVREHLSEPAAWLIAHHVPAKRFPAATDDAHARR
ncbi:hypothetical protein ACFXPA_04295 [Amycolatopsis sp. NPDC059090]|uniref:hypothetical protein n=1 Tax=unclassified Amycolatopsis TaxID=2618356 RepID=UPI00366B8891